MLFAALAVPSAQALPPGPADVDIPKIITNLDLDRHRSEAHARCVGDVPASIYWLNEPRIADYCVLRYGAPRKVGVFVGVLLSLELEREGRRAESAVVDALVDVQSATPPDP
ncbi:hypothetical protein BWI17_11290 [Betaproteobacteria bacterium GR16-43]|nr:hypothetical protein BWI17_11290 [Betaproteobacteria bacterium GR16-43]